MGTHLRPPPGPWSPGRPASSTRQLPKTATLLLTMRRDNTCTREQARSRGARPVGRPGTGTFLAAYCKRHTGGERRYVGGYSIWIHGSATRNETRKFLESWPLSFLRAGPPKSRKKAGESRTHPNLETNFAKLRPGPIRCLRVLFLGGSQILGTSHCTKKSNFQHGSKNLRCAFS